MRQKKINNVPKHKDRSLKMMVTYWIIGIFLGIFILYFLAIMPRMRKRPSNEFLINHYFAHRGFHDNEGDAPENSLKAFEYAVEKGYGIELDIQLSKDKIPVVFHDINLERVCGVEGKVKDYKWEELQFFTLCKSKEQIPRLEDVLKLVNGAVPLIIEIKCRDGKTDVCQYTYELLENYKGSYCIESFHPFALTWFRKKAPNVVRGQLVAGSTKEEKTNAIAVWFSNRLLFNFISKPDFIASDYRQNDSLSGKICRKNYKVLSAAWTVKSQEDAEMLREKFDIFIFEGFEPR